MSNTEKCNCDQSLELLKLLESIRENILIDAHKSTLLEIIDAKFPKGIFYETR